MTLKYVNEAIIKAPERVIAHGCNLKGKMGKGVALAIKERWPRVFTAYEYACVSGGLFIGAVNWADRGDDKWVANVITQNGYGNDPKVRYASYDGIDRGLRTVVSEGLEHGRVSQGDSIAVPMIGSSLGGARWSIVREIIADISSESNVDFTVYETDQQRLERASA